MGDLNQPSKGGEYFLWIIRNVCLPLLPFTITALIDFCVGTPVDVLGQESILIYTIILPILYLEQSEGEVQKYIFWFISLVGIVLFTVSQMLIEQHKNTDLKTIHRVAILALILDIVYVATASAYEAYKTFSTNRQVA
jgi:hypothetical protein